MREFYQKLWYYLGRLNFHKRINELSRHIARSDVRERVLYHMQNQRRLQDLPREEKRVHFIHIFGTKNVGDEFCGPEFYFSDLFRDYTQYIHEFRAVEYQSIFRDDVVVIGGGGLLDFDDSWNEIIDRCAERSDHVVLWGVGTNAQIGRSAARSSVDFSKIELIGVRDYQTQLPYLPCASCMIPQLEQKHSIRRRVGVIEHRSFPILAFPQYEKMRNETEDICSILQFIGSSEVIITNSYHMWYWATLMNRKVILFEKISTKFDHLRYPPVYYSGDLEADVARCETHPDALEEARRLNRDFAEKVLRLLDGSEAAEDR